jgi:hypothetical protein
MVTDIYIYCPSGEAGACRGDLEYEVEEFFGSAARFSGAGSGERGFNLDFELADGEDVESWVVRLREFLQRADARPGTFFEVFPEDWEPGMAWRRVEVYGTERWLTEREPR